VYLYVRVYVCVCVEIGFPVTVFPNIGWSRHSSAGSARKKRLGMFDRLRNRSQLRVGEKSRKMLGGKQDKMFRD
jgi:hypothetical protein